jgi:hypothetical protein
LIEANRDALVVKVLDYEIFEGCAALIAVAEEVGRSSSA